VLAVSQFTLYGDTRKGRRPSFDRAAPAETGRMCFDAVVAELRAAGVTVQTGTYRAHMQVELVNDGPVTILLDSRKDF
jgi:D-tyrosyl-tRNA(Tyr) deacylase